MPVHVTRGGNPRAELSSALIKRSATRMLAALQIEQSELSILLTDDDQIQILNRDYRKKNRPTDVLAFAMREGERGELAGDVLGDVVISVETALRQATARGHALREEAVFLLAHGLLHLLGWDHETKAKDAAMRREAERLCLAAGVPAPPDAGKTTTPRRVAPSTKKAVRPGKSRTKRAPRTR